MNVTPPTGPITREDPPNRVYVAWFSTTAKLLTALTASGVTGDRPTAFLWVGRPFFDTTLGQPIWYDGSGWIDATGASA